MGEGSWITIIVPPTKKNAPIVKATSSLWLGAIHAAKAPLFKLHDVCARKGMIICWN